MIDFRVLGPLELFDEQRPVAAGGPKQRALLAALVLRRGEVVSTDRLIDALWGEQPPPSATKLIQGYVSHLRRAIGGGLLVTRGGGYVLETVAGQVDLDRFEVLVAEAHRAREAGDPRAASDRLRAALALWRGAPLGDLASVPFARGDVARLEEARLAAVEDRIDADLVMGEHAALVGELEGLVRENPLRERVQGQLMLALYRSGRQADALEIYRTARRSLLADLGLEPGRALRELERAILAQDPGLDEPSQRARQQPTPSAGGGRRAGLLIAAAAAVLLSAIALVAIRRSASGGDLRAPPNSVAAIDPHSNILVASVPVGARPDAVASGSGSLWVANVDDQTVSRVDPTSLRTLRTLPLTDSPTALAVGANRIWVVGSEAAASRVSVNSIDPQFNDLRLTQRLGNIVPGGPGAAATDGQTIWVAPSSGLLTQLDPATRKVLRQVDPHSGPTAIAVGNGVVWVTDSEGDNVTPVDSSGVEPAIAVGNGPSGIAAGYGAVWVADSLDNAVVRIDPNTRSVTSTIRVGRSPVGVATGAGSVWVANSGDGTVDRIDPRTSSVVARIAVGGSPQAIALADRRVWVTVDAPTSAPAALASGGTLRMDAPYDVDSMDPALAYTSLSEQLLFVTCAKLLNNPDKSGSAGSQLTAEVAQSLPTRSGDGRTYTFTVRTGFRFSPPSSAPVTAQTFKDTIERTLNPRMHSPVAQEFSDIAGASAYMAGTARHISGVAARGDTLTIHLRSPEPDFPARIAEPAMCAVPSDTPVNPAGVRPIPSAGPYYVASYTPRQSVMLLRNPNYQGSRPRRPERILLTMGISNRRAIADTQAGITDYTPLGGPHAAQIDQVGSELATRYGPGSRAAAYQRQQYFVHPVAELNFFELNTHRPLFSDVRLRRAVNYAVDRRALAQLGSASQPLPERPTTHYLPPDIPGYVNADIYPLTPNTAKARSLAQENGRTAVLYTCEEPTCSQQAEILKTDLARIGLHLQVKQFPIDTLQTLAAKPGAPYDLVASGWAPDYPDPAAMLDELLETPTALPPFDDPTYQRLLARTGRLTGPSRDLAYGKLDLNLARNAAPIVAFSNGVNHDFFSARIGCQTYSFYGIDLAALCHRAARARQPDA